MKYLLFLLISVNLVLAQSANGKSSQYITILNVIKTENTVNYIKADLNNDGSMEILNGENIIQVNEKEYWVKNSELRTESGSVYEFSNNLMKDNKSVSEQVKAEYGYILVFADGLSNIEVYIAGEKGSKESDPLMISAK